MAKILDNTTGTDIEISDTGVTVASATDYTIQAADYPLWAASDDIVSYIGTGDIVVNDGSESLSPAAGISLIQGSFPSSVSINGPKDANGSDIVRIRAFNNADSLKFRGTGIAGTATKDASTDIDYKLTEDRFINGVQIFLKNQVWGDNLDFQVVDVDNILGYGAGVVLDQFGTSWYVDPDTCDQGDLRVEYPALVLDGIYIRIRYNSVGTTDDVDVNANLFLHKK